MPRGDIDDTLTWKLNHFDVFDVRSYYNLLLFRMVLPLSLPPRRVFGVQKYLKGCLSFYGQQLGVEFLPLIIWFLDIYHWLIGVACVGVIRKLRTIFYYIVSLLMSCGVKFIFDIWDPVGDAEDSSLPSFWLDHLLLHCKFAYVLWSEVLYIYIYIYIYLGSNG